MHALLVTSWHTTWAPHCPPEAVERFRITDPVSAYLDAALHDIEVAETDGRVVAVLHRDGPDLATLEVAPDHKGRGIGSVLMAQAEAKGVQWLEVRAFNRPAIRFYERRGWICVEAYMGTECGAPMRTLRYHRPCQSRHC